MQFLPSHGYEFSNCSAILRNLVYQQGGGGEVSSANTAEERAAAACNRHSEAERRRRKRINGHLATLRSLLPDTIKTDKASLLGEVVRRVRELKKMSESRGKDDDDDDDSKWYMIPSESDELELTYVGEDSSMMIKAEMCCQDRPQLMMEISGALMGLVSGKLVRTQIATLGGRIKCVLWLQILTLGDQASLLQELRRALKVVMDQASFLDRNKRQRLISS